MTMQNRYIPCGYERGNMQSMMKRIILCVALAVMIAAAAPAQSADRASTPDRFRFDLTPLYANDDAWRGAKQKLEGRVPSLAQARGTLGNSPQQLLSALD